MYLSQRLLRRVPVRLSRSFFRKSTESTREVKSQVRFDDAAIVGALPIGTDVLIAETASPRLRSAFAKFLPQVDGIHTRSEITGTYHDLIRVQP
ncbi:unnamed protein product [Heligmosomoides polygyrus]|uniref:MOSC domain-containing protein n=1 Tax=Heligmosomoides polygyrus TaxID=6339 RepID=A0A183GML9_HELPZ|nr:unnamed protein product [Heligmosomoides polygyrus]